VKRFLQSWLINTLAVLVAVKLVNGITCPKPVDLCIASLLLGILNAVLRPVLMFLALPFLIVTLGLFTLVINALLLYFVGYVMDPHFAVRSFRDAFWGALIISVISLVLNALTGTNRGRVRIEHRRRPPDSGNGNGPVIDV
jgi:putative membrane protein